MLVSIPLEIWAQAYDSSEQEINLESIDLYWSADTYVPFGYEGRALPTTESLIIVEADLKISGANPSGLKYSWFLDDIFQEAKSGYGRKSLQFYTRRFKGASHAILVKIFNESRSFYIEKSIDIPITNPEVVVYPKTDSKINPSYLASAENFDVMAGQESSFLALPYFFNIKSVKDLEFEWTIENQSAKDSSFTANIFGLKIVNKQVGGSLGTDLNIIATNKTQTNQRVKKTINLNIF
jgi:hypothetical protein